MGSGGTGGGAVGCRASRAHRGPGWFLRQASKRFGGVGTLAVWRDGASSEAGGAGGRAQPHIKRQEEPPHEDDQGDLVAQQGRPHGNAPSQRWELTGIVPGCRGKTMSRIPWVYDLALGQQTDRDIMAAHQGAQRGAAELRESTHGLLH